MPRFAFLLSIAILSASLPAIADVAPDVAAKIPQADELRMKEWDQDGKPQAALDLYAAALKGGADGYEMHWKKAATHFWWGEARDPDKDGAKLADLGQKCIAEAEQAARHDEEVQAARVRLEHLGAVADLDEQARERALQDAALAWGLYSQKTHQLREQLQDARERGEAPDPDAQAAASYNDGEEALDS